MNTSLIINWVRCNLIRDRFVEQFIKENKSKSSQFLRTSHNSKRIALFESNHAYSTHILYSLICRVKLEGKIKLIAYRALRYKKFKDSVSFTLFSKIRLDNAINRPYRILKSMGVTEFIQPKGLGRYKSKATGDYMNTLSKDKNEILNLVIDEIRVGDIFYDWYLRESLQDTLDVNEKEFKFNFIFFMCNFYWWLEYMKKNQIDSVYISHSCSDLALPARIGIKAGASAYVAAWGKMHKIDKSKLFSDLEFMDYNPKSDEQFGYEINLQNSRHLLNKAKTGDIVIDAHVLGSGYNGKHYNEVVEDKNDFNILIAAHCFSDPPHSYGDMLFPDFTEWLNFIGEVSVATNFKFYAKGHPAFWESDKLHFEKFLGKFPNIKRVPSDISNLELFKQGIKVVLTVNGTIAFEAADEGILVINASRISPHMNYSFSLSPNSLTEYQELIHSSPDIVNNWQVESTEVEHFFDLHHVRKKTNFLFGDNTASFYSHIGGPMNQFYNPKVFDFWMNNLPNSHRKMIEKKVDKFLSSNKYMLSDMSQ